MLGSWRCATLWRHNLCTFRLSYYNWSFFTYNLILSGTIFQMCHNHIPVWGGLDWGPQYFALQPGFSSARTIRLCHYQWWQAWHHSRAPPFIITMSIALWKNSWYGPDSYFHANQMEAIYDVGQLPDLWGSQGVFIRANGLCCLWGTSVSCFRFWFCKTTLHYGHRRWRHVPMCQ